MQSHKERECSLLRNEFVFEVVCGNEALLISFPIILAHASLEEAQVMGV